MTRQLSLKNWQTTKEARFKKHSSIGLVKIAPQLLDTTATGHPNALPMKY